MYKIGVMMMGDSLRVFLLVLFIAVHVFFSSNRRGSSGRSAVPQTTCCSRCYLGRSSEKKEKKKERSFRLIESRIPFDLSNLRALGFQLLFFLTVGLWSASWRVKKHIKQGQGHEGGIFSIEAPLHVSNVQVLDPVTGRPCKIGYKYLEGGTKVSVSRGQQASGAIIPRPEILKQRRKPRPTESGPKDTPIDLVLEKTYDAKAGIGMPDL